MEEKQAVLQNVQDVVRFLNDEGWRIQKSQLYEHRRQGKIRSLPDGTYSVKTVKKYAANCLRRIAPADRKDHGDIDRLQRRRMRAETDKMIAQAVHWTVKAKAAAGAWVPRETFEMELARRAAIFRNDLETFARSAAAEMIGLVNGDAGKTEDLIAWLLARSEDMLARYDEDRELKSPASVRENISAAALDRLTATEDIPDGDGCEEDGEEQRS